MKAAPGPPEAADFTAAGMVVNFLPSWLTARQVIRTSQGRLPQVSNNRSCYQSRLLDGKQVPRAKVACPGTQSK